MTWTYQNLAQGALKLNISIIYKKGVSRELVLTSELHASEIVESNERVMLSMNNGLRYRFWAEFIDTPYEYGPSGILNIQGDIIGPGRRYVKHLKETEESSIEANGPVLTPLDGQKHFVFDDGQNGQRVEIVVIPSMVK